MPYRKVVTRTLQAYWRLTRGLHLFVRALVRDAGGHVLLIRPEGAAQWQLPGSPVASGETAETALARAVEHAGFDIAGPARLFAIYAGSSAAGSDQIAVYVVATWKRNAHIPAGEARFFDLGRLPQPIEAASQRRIYECFEARAPDEVW